MLNTQDIKRETVLENTYIIDPTNCNAAMEAHGGELIKMMDNTSGICASRFAGATVVTAGIDSLTYHLPIKINDIIKINARVIFTGKTSVMILTRVYREDIKTLKSELALSAFMTFVRIEDDRPYEINQYLPDQGNEYDMTLYNLGKKRYSEIKSERKNIMEIISK